MRILHRQHLEPLLSFKESIGLMREVFIQLSEGKIVMPERSAVDVGTEGNTVLFMPAYVPSAKGLGIKLVSIFPGNQAKGVPTITSQVLLADADTGIVKAMLEGGYITAMRTAAVSALAADILARKDASVLGMFGAGVQAKHHIMALCAVRQITSVRVYDSDSQKANSLCKELEASGGFSGEAQPAAKPSEVVEPADLIVTATTASTPVFDSSMIKAGAHLTAIGSFKPHMRELDDEAVRRSSIYVDLPDAALKEAGDIIIPMSKGIIKGSSIKGLADLVTGKIAGRTSESEITLFKSVGAAMEDIILAAKLLEKAEQLMVGVETQ